MRVLQLYLFYPYKSMACITHITLPTLRVLGKLYSKTLYTSQIIDYDDLNINATEVDNMANKYYEVVATINGEDEIMFGSFNRDDCSYEVEAEKDSWKGDGYKRIRIISRETEDTPDPEVYGNEIQPLVVEGTEEQIDYNNLVKHYNLDGGDYIWINSLNGVAYYAPNDEEWGEIIAVSHTDKLAAYTNFYDMTDMEYPESEYAMVKHQGQLIHKFEVRS